MKRFSMIVIAFCVMLLSGCATQTRIVTQEVKVPIQTFVYCTPPVLAHPHLPITDLNENSTAADNQKAYAISVSELTNAVVQRDEVIKSCEKP